MNLHIAKLGFFFNLAGMGLNAFAHQYGWVLINTLGMLVCVYGITLADRSKT